MPERRFHCVVHCSAPGLHVSVWGMSYSERYCFRPVEIPRPEIPGTLPARIESREKNDIYAHLDDQGRYRVKLDFDREGTEPGYGYLWLRMAKPTAGETLGWHTPLEYGTTATYMRKVKRTMAAGSSSLSLMPSLSQSGICLSCLLEAAENGAPIVIKGE